MLTDREDAPWVLENMRGAVAANGEDLGSNCTVAGLSWGNISPAAIKLANEDPLPNVSVFLLHHFRTRVRWAAYNTSVRPFTVGFIRPFIHVALCQKMSCEQTAIERCRT